MPTLPLETRWLGRISYDEAIAMQEKTVRDLRENAGGPRLLLLEHEPVYTIGRTRDQSSLRSADALPHPIREINRGGQATYHGPGQLVGYPILDLHHHGRDLHRYLRFLEEILITLLNRHQVTGIRREGLTGVWVENRKIASIGVGVRHWITMHGFAINIGGPLDGFENITPCGLTGVEMTSLERETGNFVTVEEAAAEVADIFTESLPQLT